ncbi:hypothetical protein HDE68_000355 [Pedobacter cryoconitis]|uniref:DUF6895 domain-containing protein n=1 Tax=Pedobacter cryoconitis TaxID=188932 RepID=A0A7W8ZII9_9SPHI|nr:hypothetical protein [Pedobacter cryoconitis]MBB5634470.1 hypothetical protein [Pedobacter cryoconitis]
MIANKMVYNSAIVKSVDWVAENWDYFNPLNKDPFPVKIKNKSFAELTLVILLGLKYKTSIPEQVTAVLEKLNEKVLEVVKNPLFYEDFFINPAQFKPLDVALILCSLVNPDDLLLKKMLRKAYDRGLFTPVVASTFRVYESDYLLALCGIKEFPDEEKTAIAMKTVLGGEFLNMVSMNRPEEYELTHILFYLSDWGKDDISRFISQDRLKLVKEALVLLTGKNLLLKNNDLLSEYIMNMCDLNMDHAVLELAYARLMESQREDGVFAAAAYTYESKLGAEIFKNMDPYKTDLILHYHTTFVGLMASFTYLDKYN